MSLSMEPMHRPGTGSSEVSPSGPDTEERRPRPGTNPVFLAALQVHTATGAMSLTPDVRPVGLATPSSTGTSSWSSSSDTVDGETRPGSGAEDDGGPARATAPAPAREERAAQQAKDRLAKPAPRRASAGQSGQDSVARRPKETPSGRGSPRRWLPEAQSAQGPARGRRPGQGSTTGEPTGAQPGRRSSPRKTTDAQSGQGSAPGKPTDAQSGQGSTPGKPTDAQSGQGSAPGKPTDAQSGQGSTPGKTSDAQSGQGSAPGKTSDAQSGQGSTTGVPSAAQSSHGSTPRRPPDHQSGQGSTAWRGSPPPPDAPSAAPWEAAGPDASPRRDQPSVELEVAEADSPPHVNLRQPLASRSVPDGDKGPSAGPPPLDGPIADLWKTPFWIIDDFQAPCQPGRPHGDQGQEEEEEDKMAAQPRAQPGPGAGPGFPVSQQPPYFDLEPEDLAGFRAFQPQPEPCLRDSELMDVPDEDLEFWGKFYFVGVDTARELLRQRRRVRE